MLNEPLLKLEDITQSYAKGGGTDLLVLDGINFTLDAGEIVGLLGRSGSGKSTLLRIVSGLIRPKSGFVMFQGTQTQGASPGIAMVFQSFALFPWLTVMQNVELGLEALGIDKDERRTRALEAIDLIGLDGFESAYPKELSGGMRQRVGLARALVVHPQLLLLDEPFSALDVLTAETLRTDLIDLWTEGRLPIKSALMVTHNIEEAVLMCDRVVVLTPNPGRIECDIVINLEHPRNRQDTRFRKYVSDIYALMTKRSDPRSPTIEGIRGSGISMILPRVSTNEMAGLIESLLGARPARKVPLSDIASTLQMEVDDLFPIAEMLQLLRFAEMDAGTIYLTPLGTHFSNADTDQRKQSFAQQLLAHVPLIRLIKRVLDERPNHVAPLERFRSELEDYMSEDYAEETLRTAINWGRYAEQFAYDEETERLSLENPE
jgi:NitT/TauT family transport system ATP-binding protein